MGGRARGSGSGRPRVGHSPAQNDVRRQGSVPRPPDQGRGPSLLLIKNHPFVDGNKRVGHAALETLLVLNGFELDASVDEAEQMILEVAAGKRSRDELVAWVRQRVVARQANP